VIARLHRWQRRRFVIHELLKLLDFGAGRHIVHLNLCGFVCFQRAKFGRQHKACASLIKAVSSIEAFGVFGIDAARLSSSSDLELQFIVAANAKRRNSPSLTLSRFTLSTLFEWRRVLSATMVTPGSWLRVEQDCFQRALSKMDETSFPALLPPSGLSRSRSRTALSSWATCHKYRGYRGCFLDAIDRVTVLSLRGGKPRSFCSVHRLLAVGLKAEFLASMLPDCVFQGLGSRGLGLLLDPGVDAGQDC